MGEERVVPKIEVEIQPDGTVKVHVLGVSGPACMPLSRALETSLGVVEKTVKTGEFYQAMTRTPATERRKVSQ